MESEESSWLNNMKKTNKVNLQPILTSDVHEHVGVV